MNRGSTTRGHMEVSLNYCSQNGGNLYRAPYYNRKLNIGPRINSNLGQSPHGYEFQASSFCRTPRWGVPWGDENL